VLLPWPTVDYDLPTSTSHTAGSALFFFFNGTRFELKASCLLGRYRTTWVTPPALFVCWLFLRWGPVNYLPTLAQEDPPDLCLLSRQDYRHEPPAHWHFLHWLFLRKGPALCQGCLNHKGPICASYSSRDDQHVPLCTAIIWDGFLWTFCPG
jgi:hypothetical protein